jgi:hypothetical protein
MKRAGVQVSLCFAEVRVRDQKTRHTHRSSAHPFFEPAALMAIPNLRNFRYIVPTNNQY